MTQPVPRIGRLLDLAGIVLLAAGAAVYVHGYLGLRAIPAGRAARGAPPGAVAEAERLLGWTHGGVWVMSAGISVFVLAAVVAQRVRRSTVAR